VDLAASKLSGFRDELLDVGVVEHVACHSYGAATRFVDLCGYRARFFCELLAGIWRFKILASTH
jgi:hypothetical protein